MGLREAWKRLTHGWKVLSTAGMDFAEDRCFIFSAALSYYTLISMAPVILLTISVAGLFVDNSLIREEITERFRLLIGEQGAEGVRVLMDTLRTEDGNVFSFSLGVVLLIFSATTIFVQIQGSLNEIFRVRPMEGKQGYIKLVLDRLVSLGIIFSLGFALIISLVLDTLILTFVGGITSRFEELSALLVQTAQNLLIFTLVLGVIFSLFKWLPDAELPNGYLVRGATLTTVLLLMGKFAIGWYISRSNLAELGGAASSIVILMLWVYFSSMILFYGAEVVKAQALVEHRNYPAGRYARKVKVVEVNDEG